MIRSVARRWQVLAIALSAAACTGGKDAAQVPLAQTALTDSAREVRAAQETLGPGGQAALDSANALFRKKQYPQALAQYRAAAGFAPQHAAPLFGVYMVAQATKDAKLADSALVEIRKRNGPIPADHNLTDSTAVREMRKKLGKASPTA